MRIIKYLFLFFSFCLLGVFIYGAYIFFSLPNIKHLEDYQPPLVTTVYADDGQILGEFFVERRYFTTLDQMPHYLTEAFIAAEDERFYEHKGLDWLGMLRALIKDIKARAIVQGGSTITQQTVKSLLLSPKRTISRKIKEIILAYLLEKYLTKEEILTIYLNQIYFGHGAYGVEAASRVYFGKHVSELNLAEAAMLAGLPKGPGYYSPYRHFQRARQRQRYVLNRMLKCGYLIPEEVEQALNTPLHLRKLEYKRPFTAYFLEYVRQYLMKKYGYELVYKGGLSVYTSANIAMHSIAHEALRKGIEEIKARHPHQSGDEEIQGALLCIETQTGLVKVMLGGMDFKKSQFNRATQACRQPGSAFKPIIYAAALDKGYAPASIIYDYPIIYVQTHHSADIHQVKKGLKVWRPRNYENRFYGQTSLRDALVYSRNVATVRLLNNIGIRYVISYARRLGITSPLTCDLTLGLGSSCLSLWELTTAFSVFANQGQYIRPSPIIKIVDRRGNILEENIPHPRPVLSRSTAYLITNILEDVVKRGTGRRVRAFGRPVAGKTGTTNDYTNAWFIGYTPYYITGIWVGYDTLKSLGKRESGGRAAAPIWLYFMQKVEKGLPTKAFPIPSSVVFARIDPHTGILASPDDPNARLECFKKGYFSLNVSAAKEGDFVETIYKKMDF